MGFNKIGLDVKFIKEFMKGLFSNCLKFNAIRFNNFRVGNGKIKQI